MDMLKFARDAAKDAAKAVKVSPMDRLMIFAQRTGHAEVESASHWQTYLKAIRLGLIDDNGRITEAGKAYLPRQPKGK